MAPTIPILIVFACEVCAMAGCGYGYRTDPKKDEAIRNYEDWLNTQTRHPAGAAGAPRSLNDLVFDNDLRAAPERGLSRAHLKQSPGTFLYTYGADLKRMLAPVFSEGLAVVVVPQGRFGYIDESGLWAFPPIFRAANSFDHGVATARLGQDARGYTNLPDGAWVLLDRHRVIRALDSSIAWVEGFSDGLAPFANQTGVKGYIDRAGAIRIPAAFNSARPFCEDGTAAVQTGRLWGLINANDDFILQPAFEDIRCFAGGLAAAKRGKWGFVDKASAFVVPPQFYGVGDFSEGLASFESRDWPHGPHYTYVSSWGYIDRTGSVVIPPEYSWAYPFHLGIAKVGTRKTDWLIYPLSFLIPADPHYTAWKYIDKR